MIGITLPRVGDTRFWDAAGKEGVSENQGILSVGSLRKIRGFSLIEAINERGLPYALFL
jgi:hypothetical protein